MTTEEPRERYASLDEIEAALADLTPDEIEALRQFIADDAVEADWDHDPEPPRALGRTLDPERDPRARTVAPPRELSSVLWERRARPWDQDNVGACTGFAIGGLVMTNPNEAVIRLRAKHCFGIYSVATSLDPYPGRYPPTDTGSDGHSAAKAARNLGYCRAWTNGYTIDDLNAMLQLGPVAVGTPWYSSFNRPDSIGTIHLAASAYIVGGHEWEVVGWDILADMYRAANSWSPEWGDNGYFNVPGVLMRRLFTEQSDCTQVYT